MKTTLGIIVMVLLASFYGCQKNEVSPGASSSISSNGVLSGTIVNDSDRIDSIKAYIFITDKLNVVQGDIILGKSAVASNGKFSIVLNNPVLRKIGAGPSGVVVSDTTAMVGSINELFVFKGEINIGNINKSNLNIGDSTKAGASASQFMFSDRDFTIKGTEIHADSYTSFTSNLKVNYSITFKKGWNEIVLKVDSYSKTITTATEVDTDSNNITSDLRWIYTPNNYKASVIRAKTKGTHGLARPKFLFQ